MVGFLKKDEEKITMKLVNLFTELVNPLNWRDYVSGNIYYPPNSLGYSRNQMPQVEDKYQRKFFQYLHDFGIKFSKKTFRVGEIKPSQKEIRIDVSMELLKTQSNKLKKPILVSSDGYVIDGHHRWFAFFLENPMQKIKFIKISIPAKKIIPIINKFDFVSSKDIKNKPQKY